MLRPLRLPILLDPHRPGQPFPSVDQALQEPNGLLAVGGDLSPERLLNAYRHGVFPWYEEDQPILWWSPDPRLVLFPEKLKVSRSLGKVLRKGRFRVTWDQAFEAVLHECAEPREEYGRTWLVPQMIAAYVRLHRLGWAHSVEAWLGADLVGGLYGIALGRTFFGESMFHRETDASKVAFVTAVEALRSWGYAMIDCQVHTDHLASLGAEPVPRARFILMLERFCGEAVAADAWQVQPD